MAKQTMGTPCHNISYRVDNKMYRIVNVQSPIVRTQYQDLYEVDQYPAGVNAVVAVISHTGYDMEGACGYLFGHAQRKACTEKYRQKRHAEEDMHSQHVDSGT